MVEDRGPEAPKYCESRVVVSTLSGLIDELEPVFQFKLVC